MILLAPVLGFSVLRIPSGDTQNTSDLGTGVPKTRGYPNHCDTGCKKKVYEEDGVKISFHKFPEDRELFRKWIVAIRRDVGKEFRVTDHTRV